MGKKDFTLGRRGFLKSAVVTGVAGVVTSSPLMAYVPEKGNFTVPELPGIGQELTEKAMAESDHVRIK